jgi:copper homeostasis protein CutC
MQTCQSMLGLMCSVLVAVVKMVKEQVHIPVHVLIRPRSGHFVFSCTELKVCMQASYKILHHFAQSLF